MTSTITSISLPAFLMPESALARKMTITPMARLKASYFRNGTVCAASYSQRMNPMFRALEKYRKLSAYPSSTGV